MALLQTLYCHKCHIRTQHINRKCNECQRKAAKAADEAWDSKSADEKLDELRHRIRELEQNQGTARY
jgi:hypothetical protein